MLLIGKNGTGKSTIGSALRIFQSIGRGVNRVGELVKPKDFSTGRSGVPIRLEIEVWLNEKFYKYVLALELPENFRELRVLEEHLLVEGKPIYARQESQVTLAAQHREAQFSVDWHLIALPIIQEKSETDPLHAFKVWLKRMVILAPIPSLMSGDSINETLEPDLHITNFGDWFSGLLSRYPAAYKEIDKYLQDVIADLSDIQNELIGRDAKRMVVGFEAQGMSLSLDFKDLSDGEKCFFICAVILASNRYYDSLFCFWDEPDNYLSLSEVGHFVASLRRSFKSRGQFVATSHNPEAIRKFSDQNTFVLDRKSHLEPTLLRLLNELDIKENLISNLILGDIEL